MLIGTHVSLGMEGDYEAPFAAGLLKWRNRAMVMDTFFCSQMFSVSLSSNKLSLVLFHADVSLYPKKFNFLVSKNM